MKLPSLEKLQIENKKVLVRADLDFEPDGENLRFKALIPTLDYLKEKKAEIILIGHRGRPASAEELRRGKPQEFEKQFSLIPFKEIFEKWKVEVLENLRFNPGEEANAENFAQELAAKGEVFINEAFAASHREHASIVSLPKFLPHAAGFHFMEEVKNLSQILEGTQRPVLLIVSGIKEDKLKYTEDFKRIADKILIGGRLPDYIHDASPLRKDEKFIVANLVADKEDITVHSVEVFEKEISRAGTIMISGPLGKFEEEGHKQGTKRVFEAVAGTGAFRVAAGGDTLAAVKLLDLETKFSWLSVGGGASLEFLAEGTLPGIEALTG